MNPGATSLLRRVRHAGHALMDFLYPPACPLCQRRFVEGDAVVCFQCRARLAPALDWQCGACGARANGVQPSPERGCRFCPPPEAPWRGILAIAGYHDVSARAVHRFKYSRRRELGELLGRLMLDGMQEDLRQLAPRLDYIVPVPVHWLRRLERGFNQSDLLARYLARVSGLPCHPHLLRRRRYTRRQAMLPHDRRRNNVQGAFAVRRPEQVDGQGILLVDDVVTTGSTVRACSQVLREAGAREVWVACFARTGIEKGGESPP